MSYPMLLHTALSKTNSHGGDMMSLLSSPPDLSVFPSLLRLRVIQFMFILQHTL